MAFAPIKRWKLPYITRWESFQNRNPPIISADEVLSAGSWCNWAYRFAFVPYKRNGLARDRVAASLVADELTDIGPGIRLWDKGLLCTCEASLFSWWVDGEINRVLRKEAQIMKERGKKVLALIPSATRGLFRHP